MPFRFSPLVAVVFLARAAMPAESAGVWLDVPFAAQEKNGCGAASVAMVMQYWQREQGHSKDVNVRTIHRALYSEGARGVYASDLQRYLQAEGIRSYVFRGEWADLKHHLENGRPLIVALKSGRDGLHYVVATGIDPANDLVFKHDPAMRKLMKQHRTEFEMQWRGAENWTLLALPGSRPAVR
jgi:predicted double-glycine peptidase